ncbi:MAG: RnfABCDGE type electron transport complex subunit D [Clostridia bacterium]|nr:RnfABCDGE type electron transport complex subunit D [Clostridia bacterium]
MSTPLSELIVSPAPHITSEATVKTAMRDVVIALMPALLLSLYFFRWQAATVIITCVVAAVLSEVVAVKLQNKPNTIDDYSAVLTGLLLAFCLPPGLPLWMAAVGSASAIIVAKHLFGGLGQNIFNPAHVGRAILLASWPVAMTTWKTPIDGVTTATPMAIIKEVGKLEALGETIAANELMAQLPSIWDLFIGNVSGSIGETSALALIIGGIYLLYKGHIEWRIPGAFIGTVFVLTTLVGVTTGKGLWYPAFHLFGGGLMIGAIFMATDWVTSPITKKGRIIFGIGCGLLTTIIRLYGGYPEGVCYSILLMNCCTPLIDRYTKSPIYGGRVKNA